MQWLCPLTWQLFLHPSPTMAMAQSISFAATAMGIGLKRQWSRLPAERYRIVSVLPSPLMVITWWWALPRRIQVEEMRVLPMFFIVRQTEAGCSKPSWLPPIILPGTSLDPPLLSRGRWLWLAPSSETAMERIPERFTFSGGIPTAIGFRRPA